MSEVKTNKLTGTSTAGSILVTGEGNSTTTNLQQGLVKSWCHFNGTAGSVSFEDSFNKSSITDVATGRFTTAFTNNMGNAHYAETPSSSYLSGIWDQTNMTSSSCQIFTADSPSGALSDREPTVSVTTGDLA